MTDQASLPGDMATEVKDKGKGKRRADDASPVENLPDEIIQQYDAPRDSPSCWAAPNAR